MVTGATGVIGPLLTERLLEEGWKVTVLVRGLPGPDFFPAEVTVKKGDITDACAVAAALSGIHTVFHLAAKLHINDTEGLEKEYRRVNYRGTRDLVAAAAASGVERFIHFSTISVYGPGKGGAPFDESSPTNPDTVYGETKLASEAPVLGARNPGGAPMGVVLRPGAVYGPRMKGNYRRLARWIQKGIFVPVGKGGNRRSLVHERDLVDAALLCAKHPGAPGGIFNVTDGKVHTMAEITGILHDLLGKRRPRVYLPRELLMNCLHLVEGVLGGGPKGAARFPLPSAAVAKLCEDMAVDGRRISRELGFEPKVDLRAGWKEVIHQWLK